MIDASWNQAVVPTKDLRVIKLGATFAKGAKVWALDGTLQPATVTSVLEGGLMYKVKFADASKEEATVAFDGVTAPLK